MSCSGIWRVLQRMLEFAKKKKQPIVDQDELQLKDECNKPWVDAWKKDIQNGEISS